MLRRYRPTKSVITHPGARTRALYAWERELYEHVDCYDFVCKDEAQAYLNVVWHNEFRTKPQPRLDFRPTTLGRPCANNEEITLLHMGRSNLHMLHEICHSAGYGSHVNPHSVGFVNAYIILLYHWMPRTKFWHRTHLQVQARNKRLISG